MHTNLQNQSLRKYYFQKKKSTKLNSGKKVRGICAHIQKLKITRSHRDMILTHTFGKQSVNVGLNYVKMFENISSLKDN